jgi:putative NIF3 family GTP cyclohydrolase 1 type 2
MEKITVQDICNLMQELAPTGLALPWDNVSLQLGDKNWQVEKLLLTLDVTPAAVEKAIQNQVDCIVSHHPLVFKPLKQFTDPLLLKLAAHQIAVYSAHTNLDAAPQGVNFCLARKLGLQNLEPLSAETGCEWLHVSVYVPQSHLIQVREAVAEAGAGIIGNYDHCATSIILKDIFVPWLKVIR